MREVINPINASPWNCWPAMRANSSQVLLMPDGVDDPNFVADPNLTAGSDIPLERWGP